MTFGDPWADLAPEREPEGTTPAGVRELLQRQAELLVSVATGGPRIDSVNADYTARRTRLHSALAALSLDDPFPWRDLWLWYGHWSAKLGTYAERRAYIRELAGPVEDRLDALIAGGSVDDVGPVDEASWPSLQSRLADMKGRYEIATGMDDWQDVGRRCREILIDLAAHVYEPKMTPNGEEQPKAADAKNRLSQAVDCLLPGSSHDELRRLIKSAWDLANKTVHSGSVTDVDAFGTAQATVLLVRLMERAATGPDDPRT